MSSLKDGVRSVATSIRDVTKLFLEGFGEARGVCWRGIGDDEESIMSQTQMESQVRKMWARTKLGEDGSMSEIIMKGWF